MDMSLRRYLSVYCDPEDIPEFDYDANEFFEYYDEESGKWIDNRPQAMREFHEQREEERELREWQQMKIRYHENQNYVFKPQNWDDDNYEHSDPDDNQALAGNEDPAENDAPAVNDASAVNEAPAGNEAAADGNEAFSLN